MKIWQVQRNRVECGNLGGGFAADSSAAPAFISQQVEESTVEKCKLVSFRISSTPGVSDILFRYIPGIMLLIWIFPFKSQELIPAKARE